MLRRRPRELVGLAGLVLASVLVVAGCSHAAPTPAPAPATTAPPAPAPASSASPTPSPTPAAGSSSPATPQPQPSASGPGRVEPSRPVQTAAPKKLDQPARTAGAQLSLVSVKATSIKATAPGDSSGPGVLVRLKLVNTTGKKLDTSFVQVNVTNSGGNPGTLVSGSPTHGMTGSVRPGASAQGTYAFLLAGATSAPVTVSVYVTSGQPVVQFRGQAS